MIREGKQFICTVSISSRWRDLMQLNRHYLVRNSWFVFLSTWDLNSGSLPSQTIFQLSKSFTVVIQPLSTRLIKPKFLFFSTLAKKMGLYFLCLEQKFVIFLYYAFTSLWIWWIVRYLRWSTASGPSTQVQRKNSDLGGNWTHDLRIRSPLLHRLSYKARLGKAVLIWDKVG